MTLRTHSYLQKASGLYDQGRVLCFSFALSKKYSLYQMGDEKSPYRRKEFCMEKTK